MERGLDVPRLGLLLGALTFLVVRADVRGGDEEDIHESREHKRHHEVLHLGVHLHITQSVAAPEVIEERREEDQGDERHDDDHQLIARQSALRTGEQ